MICPQCGATQKEDAKFCHVCGFQIPASTIPPAQENKITTPVENKPEELDVKTFTDVKPDEVMASVKSGNLFKRAFGVMFKPKQEWELIGKETPKVPMLIFGYVLILCLIPLASILLGNIFRALLIWHGGVGFAIIYGLVRGVIYVIICLGSVIVSSIIIKALAKPFKSEQSLGRAMQLVAYSMTPIFVGGILSIFSVIGDAFAYLVGFYGIVLVIFGLPFVMKTPRERKVGFFFVSVGIIYGVHWTLYWIFFFVLRLAYLGFPNSAF